MTLSIIIPAYNESNRISKTVRNIAGFLNANKISFEIIVVPNNCSDDTEGVLKTLQTEEIPEIKILTISHVGAKGNTKGLAISTGMKESHGDYTVFLDADNATSFNEILKF